MPTDHAAETVTVQAPPDAVLATIRDVASQPEWVKEILTAQVLETYDDGTPATARFTASTPVGTDAYTLAYQHTDDGLTWSLVTGRLQTAQDARYTVEPADGATRVTFDLTISHPLPLPGFIRARVIKGLVHDTVTGLKAHLEQ